MTICSGVEFYRTASKFRKRKTKSLPFARVLQREIRKFHVVQWWQSSVQKSMMQLLFCLSCCCHHRCCLSSIIPVCYQPRIRFIFLILYLDSVWWTANSDHWSPCTCSSLWTVHVQLFEESSKNVKMFILLKTSRKFLYDMFLQPEN